MGKKEAKRSTVQSGRTSERVDKVEFDPGSRKKFLLEIKNHSKIKEKEKAKYAKEKLAKSRAELRQKHKQERQELYDELVNVRGAKFDKLPLFAENYRNEIPMAEVEATNPTEVKMSVLDVDKEPEIPAEKE